MKHFRVIFIPITLILALTACSPFGSDEEASSDELDVEMDPIPKNEAGAQGSPVAEVDQKSPKSWQDFFKPPPNAKERNILEQSIVPTDDKQEPSNLLTEARSLLALGQLEKAEQTYHNLLRLESENLQGLLELAMIYIRKKKPDDAFNLLEEIKQNLGDLEEIQSSFLFQYRYTLALAYELVGDSHKSHEILSDLIALDKTFTPGYAALASSYIKKNKLEVAEFIIHRGLDRGKEDPSLYNLLGVVTEKMGDLEKSSTWYDKSLSISPTFVPALVNKGILSLRRYDYESAENSLKKALTLQGNHIEAHTALALVYMRTGKSSDAKILLEKVLELDPQNPDSRYNLALLTLHSLDHPYQAMRLFYEVLQSSNKSSSDLKELAQSYIEDIKHTNNKKHKESN
ncbi:MAG: tetratricopeptide repeat protein [Oligoflexales bacterium]|nr:tetratricopeptide repeat protein [Oligoflexales bacterium]